jgi:hypothetical protein
VEHSDEFAYSSAAPLSTQALAWLWKSTSGQFSWRLNIYTTNSVPPVRVNLTLFSVCFL